MPGDSCVARVEPKPPGALRIVSLNTWKCDGDYAKRLPVMAQGLQALEPDIVLLQEVFRSLDGRWDTAAYLAEALQMQADCSWVRRKSRWLQGMWHDSESGMAMLCTRPALDSRVISLPSTPEDGERNAQLFAFEHGAEKFWLGNVHLSHLPHADALRQAQFHTVFSQQVLEDLIGSVWILGDFNTLLDPAGPWLSPPAPWLAEDAFGGPGGGEKFTHLSESGVAQNLDHCVRLWQAQPGRLATVQAQVVLHMPDPATGLRASDHCGLCVDLMV